jgi:hypothetical protein
MQRSQRNQQYKDDVLVKVISSRIIPRVGSSGFNSAVVPVELGRGRMEQERFKRGIGDHPPSP